LDEAKGETEMAKWNDQESTGGGTFLLGALAGALVGAGIALLMAPKAGVQVREDLSAGYNSMRDAAARRYRDLADRASATVEQKVNQYSNRAASAMNDAMNDGTPGGVPRA
jgi:gas vesicle protein